MSFSGILSAFILVLLLSCNVNALKLDWSYQQFSSQKQQLSCHFQSIWKEKVIRRIFTAGIISSIAFGGPMASKAIDIGPSEMQQQTTSSVKAPISTNQAIDNFRLPYNHVNIPMRDLLGKKATIVFNLKLDDPQTVGQFPMLVEIYGKYKDEGLNMLAFPTEQGWFEPDDDETCRIKAKEYFQFGDYPRAVVFDKVDFLGPSAHPLFEYIGKTLPNPNGIGGITLNYEKILLDGEGNPVRRYPRKFSAYDMIPDIDAVIAGEPLPEESPKFQKAWREAKREAIKSEYAFRYNYNYYNAPESMYRYNPLNDEQKQK